MESNEGHAALSTANQANWPDTVDGTRQMYDDWAKTYDVSIELEVVVCGGSLSHHKYWNTVVLATPQPFCSS